MTRIISTPTPHGYRFQLNSVTIGEGEYDSGKFLLVDDDDVTEHVNGMAALRYLTEKKIPGYYSQPVRNDPLTTPPKIDRFKKHPALANVTKEVMFAK